MRDIGCFARCPGFATVIFPLLEMLHEKCPVLNLGFEMREMILYMKMNYLELGVE